MLLALLIAFLIYLTVNRLFYVLHSEQPVNYQKMVLVYFIFGITALLTAKYIMNINNEMYWGLKLSGLALTLGATFIYWNEMNNITKFYVSVFYLCFAIWYCNQKND